MSVSGYHTPKNLSLTEEWKANGTLQATCWVMEGFALDGQEMLMLVIGAGNSHALGGYYLSY